MHNDTLCDYILEKIIYRLPDNLEEEIESMKSIVKFYPKSLEKK